MSILSKTARSLVALSLLVSLGACDSMKFWREDKPEPCPRIRILNDAAEMTRFKQGPGRDLVDVLFEARVSDVLSACAYDVDYDTRAGLIESQVVPVIRAVRGPANVSSSAEIPYFVALVDADKRILQKSNFSIKVGFPGNLTQNTVRDEPIDLAIVTDGNTDGSDYEIFIGLQLTREEMEYNQKLKAR